MSLIRIAGLCAGLAILNAGCRAPRPTASVGQSGAPTQYAATPVQLPATVTSAPTVASVAFQQNSTPVQVALAPEMCPAGDTELSLPHFVDAVLARNPSLQAMTEAWRAAAERYPQVTSLEDPMIGATLAPGSFGSSDVEGAYALEGSQKLPWFGKRAARGRAAQAEADAAGQDVQDARLKLVETAQIAFLDYYLVRRQQELTVGGVENMRQFRDTAQARYKANQVTQQDMLQADVELTELDRRKLELDRMHAIAMARINTLVRLPPNAPVPPPPAQLPPLAAVAELPVLQHVASQQRPDLAALAVRVRAEQANVDVAAKDYYPDTEFFGRYDTFWQPASTQGDLRGQAGVRMNVPLYRGRLNAAVREAEFRLSQRQAEYEQKLLDVGYEVQAAHAQLEESQKTLVLYSSRLLPIAEQNVAAARTNYEVGKASFLELAVAQRQLITLRERHQEAMATCHRRGAELDRAIGGQSRMAMRGEPIPVPSPQ